MWLLSWFNPSNNAVIDVHTCLLASVLISVVPPYIQNYVKRSVNDLNSKVSKHVRHTALWYKNKGQQKGQQKYHFQRLSHTKKFLERVDALIHYQIFKLTGKWKRTRRDRQTLKWTYLPKCQFWQVMDCKMYTGGALRLCCRFIYQWKAKSIASCIIKTCPIAAGLLPKWYTSKRTNMIYIIHPLSIQI